MVGKQRIPTCRWWRNGNCDTVMVCLTRELAIRGLFWRPMETPIEGLIRVCNLYTISREPNQNFLPRVLNFLSVSKKSILYVFLYFKNRNFPQNDNISWEWNFQVTNTWAGWACCLSCLFAETTKPDHVQHMYIAHQSNMLLVKNYLHSDLIIHINT